MTPSAEPPPAAPAAPAAAAHWRRGWPWAVGALAALALGAAGWAWRGAAPLVDALVIEPRPLQRSLQFSARVETPARVALGSTLTGRIDKVAVREGERVAAGAPLLWLEDGELRAALAQAEAALRVAQAAAASQQAVARPGADAGLLQAEATLAAAERELQRARELLAAGFVSPARLDEAERALAIAQAQRDAARAQALANRGGGPDAAGAQAQLQAAQGALALARARLAQATLVAPAAGRVIARDAEPGQIVQPGRVLLTLAADGPTELVALVDERFLGQLQIGQRAQVLADAYPQQPFGARLTRLAPAVDAERGAVEVGFATEGALPAFLREDMTLSVEVVTGERAGALVLPLRALRALPDDAGADGARVLVLDGERAAERRITLGLRTLDQAEVTGGLAAGETLLLDPTVAPGARVRPRRLNPAQALRATVTGTSRDNAGGRAVDSALSGAMR